MKATIEIDWRDYRGNEMLTINGTTQAIGVYFVPNEGETVYVAKSSELLALAFGIEAGKTFPTWEEAKAYVEGCIQGKAA
jgi:hypothetical protein